MGICSGLQAGITIGDSGIGQFQRLTEARPYKSFQAGGRLFQGFGANNKGGRWFSLWQSAGKGRQRIGFFYLKLSLFIDRYPMGMNFRTMF